jgi:hypothetical protein
LWPHHNSDSIDPITALLISPLTVKQFKLHQYPLAAAFGANLGAVKS